MKHKVQKIGTILQSVLKDINADKDINKLYVLSNWHKIMVPEIANLCRPVKFEGDILVLEAISESWRNELKNLRPQILAIINKKFNHVKIRKIKII